MWLYADFQAIFVDALEHNQAIDSIMRIYADDGLRRLRNYAVLSGNGEVVKNNNNKIIIKIPGFIIIIRGFFILAHFLSPFIL